MSDDDKRYKSYNDFDTRGKWPFGGSGAADEVPTPTGESCLRINQLLARAEVNAGEYSFGGRTEQLPPVPGLFVKNVGPISVPLSEESAQKLIAMCEISPFGRKLETLVDENVRKSWQLESNQVELKNPMWQKGIEELTTEIADRLGYKGVSLKCVLYKLLVYGEGGHFTKHKDTEKEDGMIATLVIQPPSMHEGGDLVVFRDTSTEYRHDFGKKDGTASFVTHYAVHYADAEHALEEVTKGYRLALVYSICLPPAMPEIHRDDKYQPLIEDLANAINGMRENAGAHEEEEESSDDDVDFDDDIDPDDDGFFYDGDEFEGDSFSLLLSHQYTEKSINDLGVKALKGVDRARFCALKEANSIAYADKKLSFFIAKLSHRFEFYGDELDGHSESIKWFASGGKELASVTRSLQAGMMGYNPCRPSVRLNFLNPDDESFSHLWSPYGSSTYEGNVGNESATRKTTYSRFAIVAISKVKQALLLISMEAAIAVLESQQPNAVALSIFMRVVKLHRAASAEFCTRLGNMLVNIGDPALVKQFFTVFGRDMTYLINCGLPVPSIATLTAIARTFDWSVIGDGFLASLGGKRGVVAMEMALEITDGLESGAAHDALLKLAADSAIELDADKLCSSKALGLLWKWAIACGDDDVFQKVITKFKQVDPSLLHPVIEDFSEHLGKIDESDKKLGELMSIAEKRMKWLNHQIRGLDKPFSWEMPDASFTDNTDIQSFLRGPESSMNIKGLECFDDDVISDNCCDVEQVNASFTIKTGLDNAAQTMTKTRAWFSKRQELLRQYKDELNGLMERYGGSGTRKEVEQ